MKILKPTPHPWPGAGERGGVARQGSDPRALNTHEPSAHHGHSEGGCRPLCRGRGGEWIIEFVFNHEYRGPHGALYIGPHQGPRMGSHFYHILGHPTPEAARREGNTKTQTVGEPQKQSNAHTQKASSKTERTKQPNKGLVVFRWQNRWHVIRVKNRWQVLLINQFRQHDFPSALGSA